MNAWHLRKDGTKFPVQIHMYTGDDCYEETAMCIEWLWDKCLKPDEFRKVGLSFLHSWVNQEFDGNTQGMYHFVKAVGPDLVPSIPFLKKHEEEFMKAPTGDLKQLTNEVDKVLNGEFIRVRFGGIYDDDGSKELVFRITPNVSKFNWFNTIYMFVADNYKPLGARTVTIVKDIEDVPYKDSGNEFSNMPVEEFLSYSKNPYIERLKRKN